MLSLSLLLAPFRRAIARIPHALLSHAAHTRRRHHEARACCPPPRAVRPVVLSIALLLVLLVGGATTSADAQTGRNVLVVVNATSPDSVRIGDAYAQARKVPADQVLKVTVAAKDEIALREYQEQIERPIGRWLAETGAQDRIFFIVLTKGIPVRIGGSTGLQGTVSSVDSELTLLYRKLATGQPITRTGRIENPYYLGSSELAQAKPFSHEHADIFLVSRLDGFTVDDALALIERGANAQSRGTFVLDMKADLLNRANGWLQTTADRLGTLGYGDRVLLDKTSEVVVGELNVLGYYSWGSNDPAIKRRTFDMTFAPGALAAMFVSTDGRTFEQPPANWTLGTWENRASHFAQSPQSLAGDLIHAGVTGIAGHVAEPFLDATIRPQVLFPAYVSGFTLAESYYLAMPFLSWQTVVVGDPLCAPFTRVSPSTEALEPAVEPSTELPRYFSSRRLAALKQAGKGVGEPALRQALKAEARLARGDRAGARQAFEEATALDNSLNGAHLALAGMYEAAKQYDLAIDRYRRILQTNPNDIIALNNLAFAVATHEKRPADAVPYAQRAYTLAQGAPAIADTYGWVLQLSGDTRQAVPLLRQAAAALPTAAEVHLHYAVALEAAGDLATAKKELDYALERAPSLATQDDAVALTKKLSGVVAKKPPASKPGSK